MYGRRVLDVAFAGIGISRDLDPERNEGARRHGTE